MKKQKAIGIEVEIDKLTNSIENAKSGDNFPTEISLLTKAELKEVSKRISGNLIGPSNTKSHRGKFTN